jgi:histone acetyltransferase
MNLLKQHAVTEGVEYFITYADNYAIGYFKKQGFTKAISMPKGRFHGLIKDYDGGTMMECYIHPSIDFTRIPEMIEAQRNFILKRIETVAKSHKVVYPPLPKGFRPSLDSVSRANEAAARAMAIPGVAEAGWTMADLLVSTGGAKDADKQKNALKSELMALARKTEEQQFAWPFREPVDTAEVKDYLEIIKDPIDLSTIEKRIRKGDWYKSKQMLYVDLQRMASNCKMYNDSSSPYYECAVSLEKFLSNLFHDIPL